ncbi:DUF4230 domain-containing protein [Flavihumibacter petaseus]|uniref:DUF4230 domain-containing protein n=1 Tax=Flavihumibacter petaseus NBRC 106054 TaxID=1220578 RepID=A0A0E9MVC1_9BACT|nr:DUF4230 domain-containing protein [Flavihumibacter petaseus]GAO41080.1 hypothetical protein FPE01S_01_00920 [Flavihumibacter petaseus NBRC 106054]
MLYFKHYAGALLLLVMVTGLISCRQEEPPLQKVLEVRNLSDLATTEYHITKIVKASDDKTWYKLGDRKILMSVEAVLKAGIDLSKLQPEDVIIDGKNITLNLPAPKLISLNLPPSGIKVEYQEIGALRDPFDNAARDALLAQAEKQIRRDIAATGIFTETENNTRTLITGFLQHAGYNNITIRFSPQTPLP